MKIVLLGPQRLRPTLGEAITRVGMDGPLATITAGWQEREDDDRDLHEHLRGRTLNLKLWARGEEVLKKDRELAKAHRARQERLREMQGLYRVRLEYALDAAREIHRRTADPQLLAEEWQLSIDAVRAVDKRHLERCQALHDDFEDRLRPNARDAVARQREEIALLLQGCAGVGIAGGHVGALRNRLELLDVGDILRTLDRPIFAWSAGAMVMTTKVILFHDSTPQGAGNPEILDTGMGLVPGLVALPDPRMRLRLDDQERVSLFALRFAPARCVALEHGAHLFYERKRFVRTTGTMLLKEDGSAAPGWIS